MSQTMGAVCPPVHMMYLNAIKFWNAVVEAFYYRCECAPLPWGC